MLEDQGTRVYFFYGRTMVDRKVVEDLVESRDGELLDWHVSRRLGRPAPFAADGDHVAIFPNRKTCRRVFDFEVQIIHDLSTLLTPQYHHPDTVDYHARSLETDVASNSLTACVSEATRTDVLRYIPPRDPSSVITIYNAAPDESPVLDHADAPEHPYVLVLGTIEPRKNVGQVLALLRDNPSIANHFQFVFVGRYGWGSTIESLVAEYRLGPALGRGAVVFPGFMDEPRKNAYIRNASLLVYPSLFEGYGLPIVEAMKVGVPCVTTASSSMPEVGGDACFYFDPFSPGDFRATFIDALIRIETEGEVLRDRCRKQANAFSWAASYERLLTEIRARLPGER